MSPIPLYFDVISPYAYILQVLLDREPLPVAVTPTPVLFAGLLQANAHKGPAEIPRKRQFTYEFCTWLAESHGIPFQMPAAHPFNPLRYLRLILAADCAPAVTAAVFRSLFASGLDPERTDTFDALVAELGFADVEARCAAPEVKARLRSNTDAAAAAGVFGVPTLLIGEHLFWGVDALPMARAYVDDPTLFERPAMRAIGTVRFGAARREAGGTARA
jgi:2-hydroxychromene-2-carboxylate isomerase